MDSNGHVTRMCRRVAAGQYGFVLCDIIIAVEVGSGVGLVRQLCYEILTR